MFGLCLLAACHAGRPPDRLSENLAGWRRIAIRDMPLTDAPAIIPRAATKIIREADYDGPGRLTVRLYEMKSEPLALDLAQRWPPQPNTVVFYDHNYFAVITWQNADRQELHDFVRELERKLAL